MLAISLLLLKVDQFKKCILFCNTFFNILARICRLLKFIKLVLQKVNFSLKILEICNKKTSLENLKKYGRSKLESGEKI